MNDQPIEKPQPLAIDLDQWRRDINTFASTTKQALDGIVSELSNQCTDGFQDASKKRNFSARKRTALLKSAKSGIPTDKPAKIAADKSESKSSKPNDSSSESSSTSRLSDLKDRLAQRIAKNG